MKTLSTLANAILRRTAKPPHTLPYLLLLPLALCGCSMLSYTGPGGERFSRFSFGSKTAIASLSVEAGTNGVRQVNLQGYQNDANQALGTVTEAAVRAAMQRLQPVKP